MKNLIIFFLLLTSVRCDSQNRFFKNFDSFFCYWVGKPYKFGGTSEKGIDCSAFVQKFFNDVHNIKIPRTSIKQFNFLNKTTLDNLKFGDILYFKSKVSPSKWHCGIYIGNDEFIHAANSLEGVKVSCLYNQNYIKNLKGVRCL
jgi:cell wall-associated NlpC family hydrolase